MSKGPFILLVGDREDLSLDEEVLLSSRRPIRNATCRREIREVDFELTDLVVITERANREDRSLRPHLRDRCDVPIFLLRSTETEIPRGLRLFDDAAFADPQRELTERLDLLISLREMSRRSESLGVQAEEIRTELAHYGLEPDLVGPRGLTPPGRVKVNHLVNVDAVNRQQMAICRLMGTSFGTFLQSWRPRGLPGPDGNDIPPTGVLSPYCAYLSSQGERCERSEYCAAIQSMETRQATESTCVGGLKLFTVPVSLTLGKITWPLFAATVAVGGLPSRPTMERIAERFGVNKDILQQIAEESRFWFLNPDKVGEIKETFSNLAETISREISNKYATAYQLVRRILFEREIRRSQRLLRENHRALEDSNHRLKQKNEEIYDVTNAITHDLKKPLVSMKAMIGMLHAGRLGDLSRSQLEAVETAQEAAGYMQQLVEDILEAARLDAGRRRLEFSAVPLRALVDKVVKRFRFQLDERGIELEVGPLPEKLQCDESAIEKVLMNLIGNSISYIGDGENRISVQGAEVNGELRISVQDTGIGIPTESLPHVFVKFRRGDNVSGIRGTGLGLAIVRAVVEAHGGRVSIRCPQSGGTVVSFTLPRERTEETEPPRDWTHGVQMGGR